MVNKKKVSIIGASFLLLAAVVACVVVLVVNKDDNDKVPASSGKKPVASIKSIQAICQPTDYRKTCEEALMKEAGNTSDLRALVRASFKVPLEYIKAAANRSSVISAASKDPETTMPLETCRTLFSYAVQDLEEAVTNILGYEMNELDKAVYDMKNWITAANNYQYTCLEEFKNKNSRAALAMKKALNTSMQLTSNALTIADQIGNMITGFDLSSLLGGISRKLLAEKGHPTWLSEERRELLQLAPWQMKPLVVVAKDGSGQFKTINEGIAAMPRNNEDYVVMYVKEGVYIEQVTVERKLNKLVLIGDGPTKTRISGNLNVAMGNGMGTFRTATFGVAGDEFIAKDIGFENTAGPEGHQAVALRSNADLSVFYNCHFDGYQDTLYAHAKRQYYRDCTISGTVDFIFGDSSTIFQNCKIVVRKPMANQQNIVTAHGGRQIQETTAFVIHNCTIVPEPALVPFVAQNPSYLGRPWKPFARTIIMQSDIDSFIHPDGWLPWVTEPDSIRTCYYVEVDNRGPGADKSKRVKWPGVQELTMTDAQKYTLQTFFAETDWPKKTGVPHIAGMLPMTEVPNAARVLPMTGVPNVTGVLPMTGVPNVSGLLPTTGVPNVTGVLPMTGVPNISGLLPMTGVPNVTGVLPMTGVPNVSELLPMTGVPNVAEVQPLTGVPNVSGELPIPMTGVPNDAGVQPMTGVPNVSGELPVPMTGVPNDAGVQPMTGVPKVSRELPVPMTGVPNDVGVQPITGVPNVSGELPVPMTGVPNDVGVQPMTGVPNVSGDLPVPMTGVSNVAGVQLMTGVPNVSGDLPVPMTGVPNVAGVQPMTGVPNVSRELPVPMTGVPNVAGVQPMTGVPNVSRELPVPMTGVPNVAGVQPMTGVPNVSRELPMTGVPNVVGVLPMTGVPNVAGVLPMTRVPNVPEVLPKTGVTSVAGVLPMTGVPNIPGLLPKVKGRRRGKGRGRGRGRGKGKKRPVIN